MTRRDGLPGLSVPHSACRRASKSLDDAPHHLRLFSYPTDRMGDPYGSFSSVLGIGDKKP